MAVAVLMLPLPRGEPAEQRIDAAGHVQVREPHADGLRVLAAPPEGHCGGGVRRGLDLR